MTGLGERNRSGHPEPNPAHADTTQPVEENQQLNGAGAPESRGLEHHPARTRCGSQPHFPLDFFLVGFLFPVAGITTGALGFIFLAITPPITLLQSAYHHITCRICVARRPQDVSTSPTSQSRPACLRTPACPLGAPCILPPTPRRPRPSRTARRPRCATKPRCPGDLPEAEQAANFTNLRAYCAADTDLLPLSWTPREGGMTTRR